MSAALLDDLQLVISELVTNAVVHARTPLRLLVRFDGARVVAEVFDADSRLPTPAVPVRSSQRPMGLRAGH
jgi:anti-sigma regulatory factor (Ser/Thr protein kinase)